MKRRYFVKSVRMAISTLLLVSMLAGCIISSDDNGTLNHIGFGNGQITIKAQGKPVAIVSADGSLRIDGDPVALTPPQQALLKRYHAEALQLRSDGLAVGSAGIAVAGKAVGSAISGLLGGDPDQIEANVEAEAERIEASVATLCDHLADLQATGNRAAAALPQFRPYASIELGDCRERLES